MHSCGDHIPAVIMDNGSDHIRGTTMKVRSANSGGAAAPMPSIPYGPV